LSFFGKIKEVFHHGKDDKKKEKASD